MISHHQSVQKLRQSFNDAADALLKQPCTAEDIEAICRSAKKHQIQFSVQNALVKGADVLRGSDVKRINQRATNLFSLAFSSSEKTANETRRERQASLRQLDIPSLILCSLSYTITDIKKIEDPCFAFLIENVASFIQLHGLSSHMYCKNIADLIRSFFKKSGDQRFISIMQSYYVVYNSTEADEPSFLAQGGPQAENIQQVPGVSQLSTGLFAGHASDTSETTKNSQNEMGHVNWYSEAAKSSLDDVLGIHLSVAIQNSRQWQSKEHLGIPSTDCVLMSIPEDREGDAIISVWVDREMASRIGDLLDIQLIPAPQDAKAWGVLKGMAS
ncbi:hypothetical protein F4680DRAFT_442593 [Xylaria scruposa]|nr:hypothetical protein F4680DRAFT_442593 [Xylaria scruposa]